MTLVSPHVGEPLSGRSGPAEDLDETADPIILTEETVLLWRAFAPLPVERRRWALTRGAVDLLSAGERLIATDEVVVIIAGAFAPHVAGTDFAADILGPGDVVASGFAPVEGQWLTEGRAYRTSRLEWEEAAGAEGLSHLLEAADVRRERLERNVACASRHRANERIADVLVALNLITGLPVAPLSQERLGLMLGLRRTTVNASCRALQDAGVTRTVRGQIRLTDIAGLTAAACGCRRAGRRPPSHTPSRA